MITKDHLLKLFDFDHASGSFYWKNPPKNHMNLKGLEAGNAMVSRNGKFYWKIKINGKHIGRGRLVFLMLNGRWPIPCVDHINGDSLDDTPANLREATFIQNVWNRKGNKKSTDLPMGIRKNCNKYVARISHNKKHFTIGSFGTVDEAARAYTSKRKELFGEFSGY